MLTLSSSPQRLLLNCFPIFLLLLVPIMGFVASGQQKRPAANATQKTGPNMSLTFDTLLASGTYKIYGEVRGVGQLIRSNAVNELLEPVMKLATPPKEFKVLVKWLNTHADAVMTSRMFVAGWPTAKNVPDMIVALEFTSPEEATKFEPQLNDLLPRVLPTPTPNTSPSPSVEKTAPPAEKPKAATPPKPNYYLKQVGQLLLITSSPVILKNLRPTGSEPLMEDVNFRVARDRFNSESVFVFVDMKGIEKEEQERRKQIETQTSQSNQGAKLQDNSTREKPDTPSSSEQTPSEPSATPTPEEPAQEQNPETPPPPAEIDTAANSSSGTASLQEAGPDPMNIAISRFTATFFGGTSKWPEGIGVGIALDNESFDARVLLVNSPGKKSDPIPFLPLLIPGPAITPESPSIFPVDTELLVTMSVDLPQIYAGVNKSAPRQSGPFGQPVNDAEQQSPFAALEKKLGINFNEELLPLLGSEVVFSMPLTRTKAAATPEPGKESQPARPAAPTPIIAVSLRDKERMRALLPKIIDSLGLTGVTNLAEVEKRGDTEVVSYLNAFAYGFIGNFFVFSQNPANLRHVVDAYLKNETLASDINFKNYTRWQPRQLQGQVYISPALMESYRASSNEPNPLLSDQTREFLARLTVVSQPVTYSLSNDGLGALHELHIPKNLLLMAVAGFAGETNPSPMVSNERSAVVALYMIANAEAQFRSKNGNNTYATLDQLLAEKAIVKEMIENHGYKIEVSVSGNRFEVHAIPLEYGKTGRTSYFVDESNVMRAGDHGGGPATIADKPISQ